MVGSKMPSNQTIGELVKYQKYLLVGVAVILVFLFLIFNQVEETRGFIVSENTLSQCVMVDFVNDLNTGLSQVLLNCPFTVNQGS